MTRLPRGELPEDLGIRILWVLGDDPVADVPSWLRVSGATAEQLATVVARWCFDGAWHDKMLVQSRDAIVTMVENYFTPSQEESVDLLAQNAADANGILNVSEQATELVPTMIPRPPGPGLKIIDTRERS